MNALLFTIAIFVLLYFLKQTNLREGFETIPSMDIPSGSNNPADGMKLTDLNASWRKILQYLSENPEKSSAFIADVREKFFNVDACPIKTPRIDFKMLPDLYRPVFF